MLSFHLSLLSFKSGSTMHTSTRQGSMTAPPHPGETTWKDPGTCLAMLPAWVEHWSAEFDRKFWLREDTGETTWKDPSVTLSDHPFTPATPAAAAVPAGPSFSELHSEEHGVPYWVNDKTGEATWQRPPDSQAIKTPDSDQPPGAPARPRWFCCHTAPSVLPGTPYE